MAVKIRTAYLPVELELWGGLYETVDLNNAETQKETDLFAEVLSEEDEEKALAQWGEYLDLILKPVNGTKKPSTALKAEAKADRISSRGVVGVVLQIRAAEQGETAKILQKLATGRPT